MTETGSDDGAVDLEANTGPERARAYYRALDENEYALLERLLTPEFTHDRPDRTFHGRERFIEFMRDDRPIPDTTHPIEAIFTAADSDELAVRGRLIGPDGEQITAFVDVFLFDGSQISRVETFGNS